MNLLSKFHFAIFYIKFVHNSTLKQLDIDMRYYYFLLLLLVCFQSCIPDISDKSSNIKISLSDPEIQKILDFGDRRDFKALYPYLSHEDDSYRYQAIVAMGSIKNPLANDSIVLLLNDPNLSIRAAAAYALGQSGDPKMALKLITSFKGKDTLGVDNLFNSNVLEAVGKVGNLDELKSLATIKTYRSTDTLLLLGQAKAIFRMALRNIVCDEGTSKMVDILYTDAIPKEVKIFAAQYLARAKDISLDLTQTRLTEIFNKERNPDIRMSIATAMGKSKDTLFFPALKTAFIAETDYRVRTNILRALGSYPYEMIKDIVLNNIKNENLHIASVASGIVFTSGISADVPIYAQYDTTGIPWQVRAKLNAAVLQHTGIYFTKTKKDFSDRIKKNMDDATNIFEKAAYLDALCKDPYNFNLIATIYKDTKINFLKMTTLQGMGSIMKHPQFYKAFGSGYVKIKSEMLSSIINSINSGDAGQIVIASELLKDSELQWKEWVKDITFLKDALGKLKLPAEIETYNELQSCISLFEKTEFTAKKLEYNHPIDWTILAGVGDSSIAAIKTNKGLIRIVLYKNQAPGSVCNFIKLIQEKFYNGKIFHRVVPNFVVQTGCPRGDGYGSPDYTIRTEVPQLSYISEGYVGTASAGQDTEGSQWFITHSATPHLDGNYTIFGKVIEGMSVVHDIQVGDVITDIIFVK